MNAASRPTAISFNWAKLSQRAVGVIPFVGLPQNGVYDPLALPASNVISVFIERFWNLAVVSAARVHTFPIKYHPQSGWYDESPLRGLLLKSFNPHLLLALLFTFLVLNVLPDHFFI
jgi:hypothetical protein